MVRGLRNILIISFFVGLLLSGFSGYSQNRVVDSLQKELNISRPDTNRINLLNSLAFHFRGYDTIKARKFRHQALVLSEKLSYLRGKGWYNYLEGVSHTYRNKFLPALKSAGIAIKIGKEIKDYDLVGRAYNTIGVNHLRLEDDSSAMKAFTTALRYINQSTDQTIKPALLLNIGQLYSKRKKYSEALSYFHQSRKAYMAMGNKWGLSLSYLETGKAYLALKNYDKAISNGSLSLEAARESKYTRTAVNALIVLGWSHLYQNNLNKSRNNFEAAIDNAKSIKIQDEKLQVYNGLAILSEKEGKYKEAFFYRSRATLLSDSIFNGNRSRLIREYQEKFQTEQKATENKLLLNQQKTIQSKFRERNQTLYLTMVVLAAFVIFSSLLYWGNRHIKKANYLLIEQKDKIQKQKDNVEQLNHIKDKLFSLIAHDLRSPFASMKSMMDMYDEGMIAEEDLSFFFKEIRKDIGFNSLLLDNLLIWAKSQLSGFKIEPKAISIDKLSDQVLYHFKKHLENKEILILKDISPGSVAYADYEMTNSVIRNLVGNAIKFTPRNGTIKISCTENGSTLQIQIKDSGIGIPEENKEKIFQDIFFTTRGLNKEKGTGLGLQICKEFVEKNSGHIWVESQVGNGSTFCFTLPKSTTLPAEIEDNEEKSEQVIQSAKESIKGSMSLQMKYDSYEILSKASLETIWDSDLLSREISWNEALNVNFGYPDEKTSIEWWYDKIHPEDLDEVKISTKTTIEGKNGNWESEYRFRCADGQYKFVLDRGLILYDDKQNAFRSMGIMQNIDAQKNAIKEIQRLSLVATNVNNMVVITDADNKVVWVNKAFVNHTGYSLTDVSGKQPQRFLSGPDTAGQVLAEMEEEIVQKRNFSAEIINYTKSGGAYWVQIDTTQYLDPITNQTGYVSIQTVITERKENERIISNQNRTLKKIAQICSYDVQMPLYSILSLIKRLNSPNMSGEDFEEAVALLDISSEKLDSLICEIHNQISKIEREVLLTQ